MVPFQLIFAVTVVLTVTSGIAAIAIVTFGNTRDNAGQRAVAEKFAQIALIGTGAIVALMEFPK